MYFNPISITGAGVGLATRGLEKGALKLVTKSKGILSKAAGLTAEHSSTLVAGAAMVPVAAQSVEVFKSPNATAAN